MGTRARFKIAADLRAEGEKIATAKDARARLTGLYVEGRRAGMAPAEMAALSGDEPGNVRRVLSEQRKAGRKIDHAPHGPQRKA